AICDGNGARSRCNCTVLVASIVATRAQRMHIEIRFGSGHKFLSHSVCLLDALAPLGEVTVRVTVKYQYMRQSLESHVEDLRQFERLCREQAEESASTDAAEALRSLANDYRDEADAASRSLMRLLATSIQEEKLRWDQQFARSFRS